MLIFNHTFFYSEYHFTGYLCWFICRFSTCAVDSFSVSLIWLEKWMRTFIIFIVGHLDICVVFLFWICLCFFPPAWAHWVIMKCGYLWFILFLFFFYCSICFSSFLILFGCLSLFFCGYFRCIALRVSSGDCYREVFSECYQDLGPNLKRENRLRGFDDWCLIEKLNRNRLNMSYGAFEYGLVTEYEIRKKTPCILHLLKRWSRYH